MKPGFTFLFTIILTFALTVMGQIPQTISHQGILTDNTGTMVPDGDYTMSFNLYNVSTAGSPLWSESQMVSIKGGVFNVILGSLNPLDLPFNEGYWLGITIDTGTEMLPRIELTSSAYSLNSLSVVDSSITGSKVMKDQLVRSVNSLKDEVFIVGQNNISVTQNGDTLKIAATGLGNGDITAVNAGNGLINGGIFGDVTLDVESGNGIVVEDDSVKLDVAYTDIRYINESQPNSVSSSMIQNGNITNEDLSDDAVTGNKILDGTIQSTDLAFTPVNRPLSPGVSTNEIEDNSVTSGKIQDGQVANTDLSGDAVTSDKILDGTIQTADLAFTPVNRPLSPGVSTSEIADNAVTSAKIQDDQVTNSDLAGDAVTSNKILDGTIQTTDLAFAPVNRPLSPGVSTNEIEDNSVTSGKIQDGQVANTDLSGDAVTSDKILDGTIQTADLAFTPVNRPLSPGVSTSEIADNAVTSAKIQDDQVTNSDLAGDAVTSNKILDGTIQTTDLAFAPINRPLSPGVSTEEIADNAITVAKIQPYIVSSVDGVTNDGGNIDLIEGSNITIIADNSAKTITIASSNGIGDNLGNHIATQNINLNGNYLSGDGGDEGIFITNDGKIGIGTTNPFALLSVERDGAPDYAISGMANKYGIYGRSFHSGDEYNYGGYFTAEGIKGIGVWGWATNNGDGTNYGGHFQAEGYNGCGVRGVATNDGDVINYGGEFRALGTYGYGVYGRASGANGRGVYGMATNSGDVINFGGYFRAYGNKGRGVYGHADGNNSIGVYGYAPAPSYAGFFNGDVQVTGSVIKGAGSFKIDHPLDPENKFLYHSFVESPDMMNVYNGNIITDDNGNGSVDLPEWFMALNKDFRYQLTVIGIFAQAIISEEVNNNQFSIKTDKPNVKVSWQITGIRQDAYANANRIPVEEIKNSQDKGKFIHPEVFGMPKNMAVYYNEEFEQARIKMEKQEAERERIRLLEEQRFEHERTRIQK